MDAVIIYFPIRKITYFPRAVRGFQWDLIISRLRIPIVTIVTESAFFVTIFVTESGPILKSLHQGGVNYSGKREKGLFSGFRRRVKIV